MRIAASTVRVRLTLTFGALTLVTGAVVLGAGYAATHAAIAGQAIEVPVLYPAQGEPEQFGPELKQRQAEAERQVRTGLQARTPDALARRGLLALAASTVVAVAAGWLMAGRIMRPAHELTVTARRIAERNLHERIPLTRPEAEWRELAAAVNAMLARLDTAFEGQRQFVGNASHELKTPLAINRTLLEVALSRPDTPAQLRQLGETLLDVNARHERLVDELLMLARSGHRVTNPVRVDLAELAAAAIDVARAEATLVDVTVTLRTDQAPVDGDQTLLERLVQNVVSNAVRHNTRGGWVEVTASRRDGLARLTVTNTGPLVPTSSIPALFEPFQRATNRVGSVRSTGLGLSIVRSAVAAHDGTVTATARDEGGLVVEVRLPAAASRKSGDPDSRQFY